MIIPVYNERSYIGRVLSRVQDIDIPKEIIIVDNGSTDGSRELLQELVTAEVSRNPGVALSELLEDQLRVDNLKVVFQERNRGKGAALRRGFQEATGDVIVIQDADLEYDPRDWYEMFQLIAEDKADVVYGSRFYGKPHRALYWHHFLGNKVISSLVSILCDITLSDIEVCYKMFRREVLDSLHLVSDDFGFEVEFTVKVAQSKCWRIYETGIHYYGRTYDEGKKITWRDGVKALWYILRFRYL